MKHIYAHSIMTEASKVMAAASFYGLSEPGDGHGEKLLNALGSLAAVVAAASVAHDGAHMAAAQVIKADELLADGPEGYNVKCADHEWVSAVNSIVTSGEMCKTCYDNGEANIPIRATQGAK